MQEEYELIYKKYYKQVYLFLYRLCRNEDLTDDLTQETFYQTFVSLHRYRGESDMFTFIAAIGKHTYFKYLRKNKHTLESMSLSDVTDLLEDEGGARPEYVYERADENANVRAMVKKIPEKYRDVIIYRIYAEMSFAQIAKALNITENSAKVIFYRGKKMLMEELKNGDFV